MRLALLLCLGTSVAAVVPEDLYDITEVDDPRWPPVDDRILFVTSTPGGPGPNEGAIETK